MAVRTKSSVCAGAVAVAAMVLVLHAGAGAQVAPLAPRWLAGTPLPPVETFSDGLERHHIALTEPALLKALRDSDGEVRSLAAAQLAAMDDHPALKYIVRAFQDERDPQVQTNLAGAASWLGSQSAIKQLKASCEDVNVPALTRLDAARYISNKQMPDCFPAVQQIASIDQDATVRVQAVMTAVSYRGQADGASMTAAHALQDGDPAVRIAGADGLRTLHAANGIGALQKAIPLEADGTVREHLREALRVLLLAGANK
jgi:HEAT repeat protein